MEEIKTAMLALVENAFNKGNILMNDKGWDQSETLEVVLKDILTSTLEVANDLELDIE